MKKSFKPASWLYPQPALAVGTYDEDGTPNLMIAAWTGIFDTNEIYLMLDHNHLTTDNIRRLKAFTASPATEDTWKASDYIGIVSGKRVKDKVAHAGFHAEKSKIVNAPVFLEYPMTFECEVIRIEKKGEDYSVVGAIKNILADESILTNGRIDPMKLKPISFDPVNGKYLTTGPAIGRAFSNGRL